MSRKEGRILAFQALYSYDVGGIGLEDLLKFEWTENPVSLSEELQLVQPSEDEEKSRKKHVVAEDSKLFAKVLISGCLDHIGEVDEMIKSHLSGKWELGRINRVTLAILRISVYSLLFQKDIHPTIIIDEAINLSRDFGSDDSFKFINAILDTISKEIQK